MGGKLSGLVTHCIRRQGETGAEGESNRDAERGSGDEASERGGAVRRLGTGGGAVGIREGGGS